MTRDFLSRPRLRCVVDVTLVVSVGEVWVTSRLWEPVESATTMGFNVTVVAAAVWLESLSGSVVQVWSVLSVCGLAPGWILRQKGIDGI